MMVLLILLILQLLIKDEIFAASDFNYDAHRKYIVRNDNAKCLDGTKAVYYIRNSNTSKWILHFQGGGWCYTLHECYLRSKTSFGSTKFDTEYLSNKELRRYLDVNKDNNPYLYNYNIVYIRYCDGGSFSSNNILNYKETTLYFKGQVIRDELIRTLLYEEGMSRAEEVVISGASAGSLAVYLGIDQMASIIHIVNKNIIVRGLADSGFFMQYSSSYDMPPNVYVSDDDNIMDISSMPWPSAIVAGRLDYATAMRNVFTFMNIKVGANRACITDKQNQRNMEASSLIPNTIGELNIDTNTFELDDDMIAGRLIHQPESDCIFAAHLGPLLITPVFALQPMYDPWQILYELSPAYTINEVNEYGRKVEHKLIESILYDGVNNPGHGAFIDSCSHHTRTCLGDHGMPFSNAWTEDIFDTKSHINVANAFNIWLQQSKYNNFSSIRSQHGNKLFLYVQNEDFPCEKCCHCTFGNKIVN